MCHTSWQLTLRPTELTPQNVNLLYRFTSVGCATDLVHFSVDFPDLQEYTEVMGFEFSFGWAFAGLGIMIVATLVLRFHQPIANAMGGGMADYERYKLYALIAIVVGFLTMINIVPLILHLLLGSLFGGVSGSGAETTPVVEE